MWADLFIVFFSVGRDLPIFTHLRKLIIRERERERMRILVEEFGILGGRCLEEKGSRTSEGKK